MAQIMHVSRIAETSIFDIVTRIVRNYTPEPGDGRSQSAIKGN